MKEYMLHIWGGAWNSDATPSIEEDYGITEGYHYFDTEEQVEKFKEILMKPEYRNQGLMIDQKYGEMTHKRTIFIGEFLYKGETFIIEYDFGYDYPKENALFMFTDGNYSCDCNRSLFIQRQYGEDAIPELNCGYEIELVKYYFVYKD